MSLHLVAIAISYTSVVEPSSLHARLTRLLHPYLRTPHFGADDRPVYLTHGESTEQPHQLQISTTDESPDQIRESQWQTVDSLGGEAQPGLAASDRMARYLSTVTLLSENEQPSLAAELLLPIALQDSSVTAIRVIRFPTDLTDVNTGITTIYQARVIRSDDSVALIQLRERRLSAEAVPNREGAVPDREETVPSKLTVDAEETSSE
ncbi:MAG: hypothetical protein P8L85_05170 [Rubripirellula sp.]|nr:hypothetical protein [Rubripirellula sp.]